MVDADKKQAPLHSIHNDLFVHNELTIEEERLINSEVALRIKRAELSDQLLKKNTWAIEPTEVQDVTNISYSESKDDEEVLVRGKCTLFRILSNTF